ncbi:ribbon-helix-helix domain-containing protein [Elusimicrobiota bacterium]
MIISVRISTACKKALDELIRGGSYSSHSEAIELAVQNLATLHEEFGESKTWMIHTKKREEEVPTSGTPHTEAPEATGTMLFSPPGAPPKGLATHQNPKRPSHTPDQVDPTTWVFGQFNRILPAKASCRAICNMLKPGSPLPLEQTGMLIAERAATLGDNLRDIDIACKFKDDMSISTAFPSNRKNESKSKLRFARQFVGMTNKAGRLSGLLSELQFLTLSKGSETGVVPTAAGWEFARLPNPVLDRGDDDIDRKFSKDEIDFLVRHIQNNVTHETEAYQLILTAITSGSNSPEKIDQAIREAMPSERRSSLGDPFLATQRSGAISRLADLQLIIRRRNGIRMSYEVSAAGKQFISQRGKS